VGGGAEPGVVHLDLADQLGRADPADPGDLSQLLQMDGGPDRSS
jgi:hypothetical protein